MTYKKFVEIMVEKSAAKWLMELCGEDWNLMNAEAKLEKNEDGDIEYKVYCDIYNFNDHVGKTYIVGGVASEICGICNSVIWKARSKEDEIVWLAVESTRKALGINAEKFIA